MHGVDGAALGVVVGELREGAGSQVLEEDIGGLQVLLGVLLNPLVVPDDEISLLLKHHGRRVLPRRRRRR